MIEDAAALTQARQQLRNREEVVADLLRQAETMHPSQLALRLEGPMDVIEHLRGEIDEYLGIQEGEGSARTSEPQLSNGGGTAWLEWQMGIRLKPIWAAWHDRIRGERRAMPPRQVFRNVKTMLKGCNEIQQKALATSVNTRHQRSNQHQSRFSETSGLEQCSETTSYRHDSPRVRHSKALLAQGFVETGQI